MLSSYGRDEPSARTESAPAATASTITLQVRGVVQLHGHRNGRGICQAAERSDQPQTVGRSSRLGGHQQDDAPARVLGGPTTASAVVKS